MKDFPTQNCGGMSRFLRRHGAVLALTNLTRVITKTYEYDAFGVEDDIDENDPNPRRSCGKGT